MNIDVFPGSGAITLEVAGQCVVIRQENTSGEPDDAICIPVVLVDLVCSALRQAANSAKAES